MNLQELSKEELRAEIEVYKIKQTSAETTEQRDYYVKRIAMLEKELKGENNGTEEI